MMDSLSKEQVLSVLEFAQGLYEPIVGKYGFFTPEQLNEELKALNNNASKPTYEKVEKALGAPIESAELLQMYSTWAKYSDAVYAKTLNYFSNMLSFDVRRVCVNAKDKSDYKSKEYKEDLDRVYKFFRTFDHKREFKKMVNEMLKKNVVYAWYRDNYNEDTPQKALQIMPQEFCKITGSSSLCPMYDFNMGYFLNSGTNIDMFAPIFKKYYNDIFKDNNKYNLRDNPLYSKGGNYAYWQHTSPIDGAWTFMFTDGNFNEIPPFSFLLRTSIMNPEIEALQRDKDIISAYGLLYGEMETSNKAQSGQVPNETAFSPKAMGHFLQLIASGLDKRLKPLAFPLKEVEFKQFVDGNTGMAKDQYINSAAQGASASSLIYTTDKMGVEEFKNALYTDYLMMKQLYSQFDAFLNYFVNQKTRKYKFRFTCEGSNYPSIREEMTNRVKGLADRGIVGNISMWEQAFGYNMGDLDTMCDEGIEMDKLQLMLNPNTAMDNTNGSQAEGGKVNGRPTKSSSEMTESAQVSKDINGAQKAKVD